MALVLEEVEVSVGLGDRVMDGVCAVNARHREAAARREVDLDREQLAGLIEVNPSHRPRRLDSQRCRKHLSRHATIPPATLP